MIVDGARTPFVRAGEDIRSVPVDELARSCTRGLLDRVPFDSTRVDELILGCVAQPPNCANPARAVALRSGLDESTPAQTVSRNCASGMQAIPDAFARIRVGASDTILACRAQSCSQIPISYPPPRRRNLQQCPCGR